ncbi:MAG TPA: protein kinase [Gemmataceae bacterium]|nr:protein kinase [Gemmataceae bacterium]
MDPLTQTSLPPAGRLPSGDFDLTGRTLADFHVLHHLGQGGMGQVYLAEQISLKRKVALKILRPELAAEPTALQRFKAEATAVAQATHANIVQIYAVGEADGMSYMALEYVAGRNLRDYLAKKGPPDVLIVLSIMRQVASALQRASELGIIHRDIKPENILLTRKGEVKVADFGLSRCLAGDRPALNLTQSGVTMGTPLYMSPEQVEGKPVDCRTDIYSFGVTCYHLLAGHPPFQGDSPFEVALQHVRSEPKPLTEIRPDLPAVLCAIVHKMMAKDPAARYQTGRELLTDVVRLREGLSGQTATLAPLSLSVEVAESALPRSAAPVTLPMPRKPSWWGWRGAVFLLSVLLAGVLGAAIALFQHRLTFPTHAALVPAAPDGKEQLPDQEEEKALRTVVDQYLNAKPTERFDNQAGLNLSSKLAMFYLERDRLDDALAVFVRMEKHSGSGYAMVGHLGRAIVLALRSQAQESNQLFRQLFQRRPLKQGNNWIWQEEKWRFWVRKALHYNCQNGVKLEDIPKALHKLL